MKKLNRYSEHRMSMLRNLGISLINHGKIETTLARAKCLRSFVEPMITRAKNDSLSNRRLLLSRLNNDTKVISKLFGIGKHNVNRAGGYTRIIRSGFRSDGGVKAIIQVIDYI